MSVTPTAHGASHGSGGNDAITSIGAHASGAITFTEQVAPAAPAANSVVLYCEDNGGTTVLRAKFSDGTVALVATDS
jgi:hypothetical protein